MANLKVNIPTTFEETVTASHITGIETPTQPTDAANKQYVDDAVAGATPSGDYLPLAGGTMDGTINMGGNAITNVATPSADTDVSNKQYTDYMKNVFNLGNTYIFGTAGCNINITLIYPRFDSWTDNSPSRFLGNNIISGYAWFDSQVTSATTIDITDIFTNNGFYVRGSTLYITRTQNFPMYSNNGPTNQNAYFNFSLTGSANNLGRITMTAFPQANGHFFFFNFTLPQGIEIGYNA